MLTIEKLKQNIDLETVTTPSLIIDKSEIIKRYERLSNTIAGSQVFYAMKTNPHEEVLKLLLSLGSGFEISSAAELEKLIELKVPADKIIIGNPLKTPKMIKKAFEYGINYFAFDSTFEIDKLSELAPGTIVSLRVKVDDNNSDWPLSRKFGADPISAIDLLQYAKDKGLKPQGLTFHVGSQCLNPASWSNALLVMSEIFQRAKDKGIDLDIINLGGGFPSQLCKPIPQLEEIKTSINKSISEYFPSKNIKYMIEPGRGMVGEAGIIICSVIARANRGVEKWVSLDIGVYNGLFDALEGVKWSIISDKELNRINHKDQLDKFKVGGPTCDSIDVLAQDLYFPKDITFGDIVYVLNAGAYTSTLSTGFNGFEAPEIIFID